LAGIFYEAIVVIAKRGLMLAAESVEAQQVFSRQLVVLGKAQSQKIDLLPAAKKFKMQVRPGRVSGLADIADHIARVDCLAFA
jgi:hypothetical protein